MGEIKLTGQERIAGQDSTISEVSLSEPYRPFKSNEVNVSVAQKWISSKPEDQRGAAIAIVDNIQHIGQEEFEVQMAKTVEDFNNRIGNDKYVTVVADTKSNKWALELAWNKLNSKPGYVGDANFFEEEVKNIGLTEYIRQNGIKKVAIFDDAIYSGQQFHTLIDQLKEMGFNDLEFVLAVPFISSYGKERLTGIGENITICDHQVIKSVAELIPDEETQKKILEMREFSYITEDEDMGDLSTRTLTYFDHKVPDNVSTLNFKRMDFIPSTTEPYKKHFVSDYIDYLISQGLAEKLDKNLDEDKPFWKMDAVGYKIGSEFWIWKRTGSMKQLEVKRGEESILLKNGEYMKLEPDDVLSQLAYKDWEDKEHPAELKVFTGWGFESGDSDNK